MSTELAYLPPYRRLEKALVAYLQSLQGRGGPLDDLPIYEGHGEQDLDNVSSYLSILVERTIDQPYWSGGLEQCDVKTMIQTQGDDTPLAIHDARVQGAATALGLPNLRALKDWVNANALNFGLTGFVAGKPPVEDGYDDKGARQCLFRHVALCGNEFP